MLLKLFIVTSVNFGFILNVTILILISYLDYRYRQNSSESLYCIEFCGTIFPFNSLSSNKNFLACFTNTDNNTTQWIDLENDHNSSLSLKPSNLELLVIVNQFNNATPLKIIMTLKKFVHLNIMTLRKWVTLKIPHKNKSFPVSYKCMFS